MHAVTTKKTTQAKEKRLLDKDNLLGSWDHIYLSEWGDYNKLIGSKIYHSRCGLVWSLSIELGIEFQHLALL